MFAIAARRMGYRVHTFSPDEDTPTGQVADVEVTADYDDLDALRAFARQRRRGDVRVRERSDRRPIDAIETLAPVRPSGAALHTAQQRAREKIFLADHGFPTAPFARARNARRAVGRGGAHWDARHHQDGGLRLRRQGAAQGHDAGRRRAHLGCHRTPGGRASRSSSRCRPRFRSIAARGLDGTIVEYPLVREPAPQSHPRSDDRAGVRTAGDRTPAPSRSRARSSRSCSTSACCAWSSSSAPTASCWSTSWRRGRTTPAI